MSARRLVVSIVEDSPDVPDRELFRFEAAELDVPAVVRATLDAVKETDPKAGDLISAARRLLSYLEPESVADQKDDPLLREDAVEAERALRALVGRP